MKMEYVKGALGALWLLAMFVVATTMGVRSAQGLVILVAVTLLPLMLMWWLWRDPDATMSETIDEARR